MVLALHFCSRIWLGTLEGWEGLVQRRECPDRAMAWLWSPQPPGPSPPESQLFLDLTGHCPKCWASPSLEALVFGVMTRSAGVSPTSLQRQTLLGCRLLRAGAL